MNSKYDFYEIVIIKTIKPNLKKYNGCQAVIIGKSQSEEDSSIWAYSVRIANRVGDLFVWEEDLYPTGKIAGREDFYTGDGISVKVDPNTGEGFISE